MLEAKRKILGGLRAKERLHGYALAKVLGLNSSTVYQHLRELEAEGYVAGDWVGRRRVFRLTRRGELMLEALGHS